ncbi:MAG: Flp pilus assembly protein CpaB [Candidatus Aminicenantia bacterium]
MEKRTALVLAIVVGILALILIIALSGARGPAGGPLKNVVYAKKDILPRTIITEDLVEIRRVPENFKQPKAFERIEDVVGRVSVVPLPAGAQISATSTDTLERAGLDFVIPAGMRAVTIPVDSITSVAGQVSPGSNVDIFLTVEYSEGPGSPFSGFFTKLLMTNVTVLAVEWRKERMTREDLLLEKERAGTATAPTINIGGERRYPANVTLLASLTDSQRLIMAQNVGKLTLVLKNYADKLPVPPIEDYYATSLVGDKKVRKPIIRWEEIRGGALSR